MLRQDDLCKSMLAITGWRYNKLYGCGGHLGACLVMGCIANRVRIGLGSWMDVMSKIPLYAAEKEAPTDIPTEDTWDRSFINILQAVDSIFEGSADYAKAKLPDGRTVNGIYWCDLRKIETDFFRDTILGDRDSHPRIADMNTLTVFA